MGGVDLTGKSVSVLPIEMIELCVTADDVDGETGASSIEPQSFLAGFGDGVLNGAGESKPVALPQSRSSAATAGISVTMIDDAMGGIAGAKSDETGATAGAIDAGGSNGVSLG